MEIYYAMYIIIHFYFFFFFQAEDGIRDLYVTGVQTCALPISKTRFRATPQLVGALQLEGSAGATLAVVQDRKSTRLNSSHVEISYAVFCLKKKKIEARRYDVRDFWRQELWRHGLREQILAPSA